MSAGPSPTAILAVTSPVSGSTRMTSPLPSSIDHTEPAPAHRLYGRLASRSVVLALDAVERAAVVERPDRVERAQHGDRLAVRARTSAPSRLRTRDSSLHATHAVSP